MKWWVWGAKREAERAKERDPDLDLAKHMVTSHEHRLQWLEREVDRLACRSPKNLRTYQGMERRQKPRH